MVCETTLHTFPDKVEEILCWGMFFLGVKSHRRAKGMIRKEKQRLFNFTNSLKSVYYPLKITLYTVFTYLCRKFVHIDKTITISHI